MTAGPFVFQNDRLSQYTAIHEVERSYLKIRNVHPCICALYYVDVFPIIPIVYL